MRCAFRGEADAAISGAGFVAARAADTYPAAHATPRHHPELSASFPRSRERDTEMRNAFSPAARVRGGTGGRNLLLLVQAAPPFSPARTRWKRGSHSMGVGGHRNAPRVFPAARKRGGWEGCGWLMVNVK